MAHDEHHEHLMNEITELFEPILSDSPQAVYIYLDDTHKICNQNFADLLGYDSIEDWVATESPINDIAESDQNSVIEAYGKASEELITSSLLINIKTKGGSEVETEIVITPFTYKGEVFAVHFITPKN
jgi:hypothetical protein